MFFGFDLRLNPVTSHAKNYDTLRPNVLFQNVVLLCDYFLLE